jgi:hypothetical protein
MYKRNHYRTQATSRTILCTLDQMAALLTCVLEVSGFSVGRDTEYDEWEGGFLVFLSSPGKFWNLSQITPQSLLPYLFQFVLFLNVSNG